MKNRNRNLEDALAAVRKDAPDPEAERAAGLRAWNGIQTALGASETAVEHIRGCADVRLLVPALRNGHLSGSRALLVRDHLRDCVACARYARGEDVGAGAATWKPESPGVAAWHGRRWAAAAAVVALVAAAIALLAYFAKPGGARATLQSGDGVVYRIDGASALPVATGAQFADGELVRTAAGGHAFLLLLDGSVVEMASRTQLRVTAGRKDTTLLLDGGRVIVQAAKRSSGHLFVQARAMKVVVTGTVFSVDSGLKGSRVAVIEGTVQVATDAGESLLHPGDEIDSAGNADSVSVAQEISWSKNREKHLALLAEFAKLQKKITDTVQVPPPRYQSALLPLVPADTMLYVSIPNLGEALAQANQIFRQELEQSPVLRQWWSDTRTPQRQADFFTMIDRVQLLSRYLGDEVVFAAFGDERQHGGGAMIAAIKNSGVRPFLEEEARRINAESHGGQIVVLDPAQLAGISRGDEKQLFVLVRNDYLVASPSLLSLRRANAQLDAGASGFSQSPFGQAIGNSYTRGAGILVAANLQEMAAHRRHPGKSVDSAGFSNARFLVMEHRELGGHPDNRATLDFAGARAGIPSWLGNPAPIRSLDFISPNASVVIGGVSKAPVAMFDDILAMANTRGEKGSHDLQKAQKKLGINLRDELAASLGGDFTVALDGPPLPTPSWKAVVEVTNQRQLESSIERIVAAANRELAAHHRPLLAFAKNEQVSPPEFSITGSKPGQQVHYTFVDGYMVLGPTRALVLQAVQTHQSGVSLPVSQAFQSLLPQDGHPNVSAVIYQNLSPVLDQLSSQLNSSELQSLRQIAANSKPTVIVAYGGSDNIQVASTAQFPDLNAMAFSTLLRQHKRN